jgi:hypothetical protein
VLAVRRPGGARGGLEGPSGMLGAGFPQTRTADYTRASLTQNEHAGHRPKNCGPRVVGNFLANPLTPLDLHGLRNPLVQIGREPLSPSQQPTGYHSNIRSFPHATLMRDDASDDPLFPTNTLKLKYGKSQMRDSSAGDNASNARASMSTDAPKSTCPAARKFAEYLARRMGPMIQHAARSNVPGSAPNSES